MKCNHCGQEFGKGEKCQHCGTDKVSALGEFSGYSTPKESIPPKISPRVDNHASIPSPQHVEHISTQICWKCGEIIPADAEYCPYCRKALKTKCLKCYKLFPSQFPCCPHCGTNQKEYKEKKPEIVFFNASGGGDKIEVSWTAKNVSSCRIELSVESDRLYRGRSYILKDHLAANGSTTLSIGSYELNRCFQSIVGSYFINRHNYNVRLILCVKYYDDDGKERSFGRGTSSFQVYIPTVFGSASFSYFKYTFSL